jgi:hypothetical protein
MTPAVRKNDEEMATDLKRTMGILLTRSSLYEYANRIREYTIEPLMNVHERLVLGLVC